MISSRNLSATAEVSDCRGIADSGVAPGSIGSNCIWTLPAEAKHSCHREHIEDECRRDHVFQQVAVDISPRVSIGIVGARQDQEYGPQALKPEPGCRYFRGIQFSSKAKK